MSKNNTANIVIAGLAIVGLLVVAGPLLQIAGGLLGLALVLLAWMFAGALAGRFLRGEGYGPLGDIGLGIAGGVVGTVLFRMLGLGFMLSIPLAGPILVGAAGAIVFVYVVRLFNRDFAK
jgi:uncharacterized membrane protein YeaQ/YmgE (transglycosylase-associated protein family)